MLTPRPRTRSQIIAVGLLFSGSMVPIATAATFDWVGGTSTAWATADNWTPSGPPVNDLTSDIARFNQPSYTAQPTSGVRSIAGLEIGSSSANLTLTTGGGAGLSVGASGITMESGAGNSTLGIITSAATQTWTNNSANVLSIQLQNVYTSRVTLAGTGSFVYVGSGGGTGAGGVTIDGASVTNSGTTTQFGTGVLELKSGSLTVAANRTFGTDLSFTGNFTFNALSTPTFNSPTKSTTGDVVLSFQPTATSNAATVTFSVGSIVLGGNLEILATPGGNGGNRVINRSFTGGFSMGGVDRTITLSESAGSGTTTIGLLTLDANLTIAGAGSTTTNLSGGFNTDGVNRSITFNNAGTGIPTLSGLLTGTASTVTIAGSSTNARVGALIGATAHALEVNSTTGGSFLFNGASNFTGGVTVTSGTAVLGVAGVAGTSGGFGTGALVINGGEVRTTVANALLGSSSVSLNGGTLRGFGNATVVNYGGGAITVSGFSFIINERSGAPSATSINMTFGTSVAVGNGLLNITSTDNQTGGNSTITLGDATLTGNGTLNVTDNPSFTNRTILSLTTLTATGIGNRIANSVSRVNVSGLTTVGGASAGSLLVDGLLTATGGVSVASNGTLGGSGTITGNITTEGTGSTFAPKNAPGQLTITGNLNASAGASFAFDLGATLDGDVSDMIAIEFGLTGSGTGGMLFSFTGIGAGPTEGFAYTLLTFGSSTGFERDDIVLTAAPSGYVLDTNFGDSGFLINSNDLQVQFSVIPEPGYAVVILASLGLLIWTVRRKQARV